MRRYEQWWDGEGETLTNGAVLTVSCCDCGLTHQYGVRIKRGTSSGKDTVTLVIHQKPRLTLWRRKKMGIDKS
mgnify:FL=1